MGGIVGSVVKALFGAIVGAINNWVQARKAAHAKAKANAMGTREESVERAEAAEASIDDAAEAAKNDDAETDEAKIDEIEGFGCQS